MESVNLPDISYTGPILDVPNPPRELSYSELEDYRALTILELNGIDTDPQSLVGALESQSDLLLAYAAHAAGATGARSTIPVLTGLLSSADDAVQVEAAYALTRLGDKSGAPVLIRALEQPAEGYLSSLTAAGYLAQLGDPRGFGKVAAALGSDLAAVKMLACKQLYFFQPYHSPSMDVVALFARALDDPDPNVQWQALAQVRELKAPEFRAALSRYVDRTSDQSNRAVAREILDSLSR